MSLDVGMGYSSPQAGQLDYRVGNGLFHFSYRKKKVRKVYLFILVLANISEETKQYNFIVAVQKALALEFKTRSRAQQ